MGATNGADQCACGAVIKIDRTCIRATSIIQRSGDGYLSAAQGKDCGSKAVSCRGIGIDEAQEACGVGPILEAFKTQGTPFAFGRIANNRFAGATIPGVCKKVPKAHDSILASYFS